MHFSYINYIVVFSGIFLVAIFLKGVAAAKRLSPSEIKSELDGSKSFFYDISSRIIMPVAAFLHDSLAPKLYKEFEIIISKIRINVLKIERLLLHLTHYIRGKQEIKKNGNAHPYWDSVKNRVGAIQKEENSETKNTGGDKVPKI